MSEAISLSLEEALSLGGDSRSQIQANGMNKYGTATHPRRAIPFGSCTSSSPSQRGYDAAACMQRALSRANDPRAAAQVAFQTIRRRLRQLLKIPPGVDIALAPSGTDTELIAVALAGGNSDQRVINIVVGPNEVGSGTIQAASARHYDSLVPSADAVVANDPIDEPLASRIEVKVVRLRDDDGAMIAESQLDRRVTKLVDDAYAQQAIVLLHIVAHSKTGMHAPSLECVAQLQRRYAELVVMVDAAQGRFSRKGMVQSLHDGQLFMMTGSKFFGGPPFSGALLIPKAMNPQSRGLPRFPVGFGQYLSALEMPTSWRSVRAGLPSEPNYSSLLRWAAAIAEIDAYYAIPGPARLEVLRYFESVVPAVFGTSERIELLAVYPPVYGEDRLLQSKTTVFNLRVRAADGHFLDREELRQLHAAMNCDVSSSYPLDDPDIASAEFHLGQPVAIGQSGYALRVALGTQLIARVSLDLKLGDTFDARREWLRHQLVTLRHKIDLVASAAVTPTQFASP